MTVGFRFFKVTAVASLLAAFGVLVAQFGLTEYPSPTTPEDSVRLYTNGVFRAQGWVIFGQVFLMFLALWGCTLKAYRRAPGLILTGFLFFMFWQILEIIPRSIAMSTMTYTWAPEFLGTQDQQAQTRILAAMQQIGAVLAGIGVGRRIVWALGHLMFGIAFWRGGRLMKVLSLFFLLNFARLFVRMAGEVTGWTWLFGVSGGTLGFVVAMVPLFALIGWYLWMDPGELHPSSAER